MSNYKAIPIKKDNGYFYYVIVSDEEIKYKDWYYTVELNSFNQLYSAGMLLKKRENETNLKVIAQTEQIHDNIPLFDCVWDDGVKKLAWKKWKEELIGSGVDEDNFTKNVNPYAFDFGFLCGYKAHADKYKYTESNMLFCFARATVRATKANYTFSDVLREIKQLNRPKEYEVVLEMIDNGKYIEIGLDENGNCDEMMWRPNLTPKIKNNKVIIKTYKEIL